MRVFAKTVLVVGMVLGPACADGPETVPTSRENVGTRADAIVGGRVSTRAEDYGVKITSPRGKCSGTMVAPNLAVAAYHCVVHKTTGTGSCTTGGEYVLGAEPGLVRIEPAEIVISTAAGESLSASKTLVPPTSSFCRDDVAFIVLERALAIPTARIRFGPAVAKGTKKMTVVGWGLVSDNSNTLPTERQAKDDIAVIDVGPGRIPSHSFAIGGSTTCFGDSGGGVLRDGYLLGVYSRLASADGCEADGQVNIFTDFSYFESLATQAFAAAGQAPTWNDEACDGGVCCDGGACPSVVVETPPAKPTEEDSGCTAARAPFARSAWLALVAMALLRTRRNRTA